MKKAEKVVYISNKLEELYPETPIPLNHTDDYTLLIGVLLSAQCTDERVNKTTPFLFEKAKIIWTGKVGCYEGHIGQEADKYLKIIQF